MRRLSRTQDFLVAVAMLFTSATMAAEPTESFPGVWEAPGPAKCDYEEQGLFGAKVTPIPCAIINIDNARGVIEGGFRAKSPSRETAISIYRAGFCLVPPQSDRYAANDFADQSEKDCRFYADASGLVALSDAADRLMDVAAAAYAAKMCTTGSGRDCNEADVESLLRLTTAFSSTSVAESLRTAGVTSCTREEQTFSNIEGCAWLTRAFERPQDRQVDYVNQLVRDRLDDGVLNLAFRPGDGISFIETRIVQRERNQPARLRAGAVVSNDDFMGMTTLRCKRSFDFLPQFKEWEILLAFNASRDRSFSTSAYLSNASFERFEAEVMATGMTVEELESGLDDMYQVFAYNPDAKYLLFESPSRSTDDFIDLSPEALGGACLSRNTLGLYWPVDCSNMNPEREKRFMELYKEKLRTARKAVDRDTYEKREADLSAQMNKEMFATGTVSEKTLQKWQEHIQSERPMADTGKFVGQCEVIDTNLIDAVHQNATNATQTVRRAKELQQQLQEAAEIKKKKEQSFRKI